MTYELRVGGRHDQLNTKLLELGDGSVERQDLGRADKGKVLRLSAPGPTRDSERTKEEEREEEGEANVP